jgi:hypothetical protein
MTQDDPEHPWMWLRGILNTDWDPIGGCPDDEYDRYAKRIASMLREGASDAELAGYLNWVETNLMGLFVGNIDERNADTRVAERLRSVVLAIGAHPNARSL